MLNRNVIFVFILITKMSLKWYRQHSKIRTQVTNVAVCNLLVKHASAWWLSLYNRLQLNSDKTELLWCATNRRLHQLPVSAMLIDGVPITPAMYVRDLGIYLDCDLLMRTHVQRTVSRCFAALRQLRQIRHSIPAATFQTLVVALIHSRLDYGNSVLVK